MDDDEGKHLCGHYRAYPWLPNRLNDGEKLSEGERVLNPSCGFPLLISVVVRNFGWYLLLVPNGVVDQFLMKLGIIDSPLKLLFSVEGVVIGLANSFLPFMVLSIATSLYNIDPSLEKASSI